jgi:3-oxoacyl-[acyl-carrier protein] reductase
MSSSKLFYNKTALITGVNRGIGKSLLELFVSEGASVIACARTETPELLSHVENLSSKFNVKIRLLFFDMSDEESIKTAMKTVYTYKIKIDILINNAGIATGGLLQVTSMTKLKEVFQINFFSHVLITQYVVKMMIKQKSGCIINIGSIAGLDGMSGYTSYGSSKAALMHFTRIISKEVAQFNIRVNAIAPGLTDTGMATQMESKAYNDMISSSSLNRLGKPEEIAQLALFLASEKSSFINGQIIRIDGGTL